MEFRGLAPRHGWNKDNFLTLGERMCPVCEVAINCDHHAFAFERDVVLGSDFLKQPSGSFGISFHGLGSGSSEFTELSEVGDGDVFHDSGLIESGTYLECIGFSVDVGECPEAG